MRYANVTATVALVVALGGTSYAAVELSRNSVRSEHIAAGQVKRSDLGRSAVDSARVRNRSLLARDFVPGQLPAGERGLPGAPGASGERGPQGLRGLAGADGTDGAPGANGATDVTVRTSGTGIANPGTAPSGADGGDGGQATCVNTGCVVATGGSGGDGASGGTGGTGGTGGSASCGPSVAIPCNATGGAGGSAPVALTTARAAPSAFTSRARRGSARSAAG